MSNGRKDGRERLSSQLTIQGMRKEVKRDREDREKQKRKQERREREEG